MQNFHDNVISTLDTSPHSDRWILIRRRALLVGMTALPCLLIVAGLLVGPLILLVGEDVGSVIFAALLLLAILPYGLWTKFSLLKDNPRLKKASISLLWFSTWIPRTYQQSVMGLDEREKLVVDQSFRASYRILALACFLVLSGLLFLQNMSFLYLAYPVYRFEPTASLDVLLGVVFLLQFLPVTIVAWKECA